MYIGIDGQNKLIDKVYLAVDGQNKEIDKMYISVDEQNKEFYSSAPKEHFSFVIYGNQYIVDYQSGEALNFTIDWGDGTRTAVNDTDIVQRTHIYPSEQEWTITIKNHVSGRIQFYHSANTAQRTKLRRVLMPFLKSETRTSFSSCFYGNSGLTSIPSDLFINNPNVTSFGQCFRNCTSLTTIPPDIFAHNPNVTAFNQCFQSCTGLITLPDELFANNSKVTTFSNCFQGTKNLQNINITFHPDVLARNTNYSNMFFVSATSDSCTGYAPALWNSATTTASNKSQCFLNNTKLTNYASIPTAWR